MCSSPGEGGRVDIAAMDFEGSSSVKVKFLVDKTFDNPKKLDVVGGAFEKWCKMMLARLIATESS